MKSQISPANPAVLAHHTTLPFRVGMPFGAALVSVQSVMKNSSIRIGASQLLTHATLYDSPMITAARASTKANVYPIHACLARFIANHSVPSAPIVAVVTSDHGPPLFQYRPPLFQDTPPVFQDVPPLFQDVPPSVRRGRLAIIARSATTSALRAAGTIIDASTITPLVA